MKNFENKIDELISRILKEEIESESEKNAEKIENEWMEIVSDEDLSEEQDEFDEQETEEGNAFSGALAKAKEEGKDSFEVDGKKYQVKEGKKSEKWIQKTDMKKGSLHKKLGVPEGEKIPVSKLKALKKELQKKGEGDKKMSASDLKLLKQVNLALTLKDIKETETKNLQLTEDELIDLIEKLVVEEKMKDNISKKTPEGLKKTEKAQRGSKKENEDYAKEVTKKITEYLKGGSKGKYEENPTDFPKGNGELAKMSKMAYQPSDAVEEYIDAFSYPGQTNITFDEIKPVEKNIEKYLKGDRTTGNAEVDEEGKALGNVVPSKVGEKFKKNFDENLYGAEQADASYKRQPQPIEVAGENKLSGGLKKKNRKSSTDKAQKILNQLESTESKKDKLVNEEMSKMKNLITYNRKTQ